ncbi:MAG: hypothetical protein MI673_07350 [Thiotrichales bacterium]|nr:hypothetical protein [Thiotrichales bacterium]
MMIKNLANKFRSNCGSVQSVTGRSGNDAQHPRHNTHKNRGPDCAYLLHAGFASTQRNNIKPA